MPRRKLQRIGRHLLRMYIPTQAFLQTIIKIDSSLNVRQVGCTASNTERNSVCCNTEAFRERGIENYVTFLRFLFICHRWQLQNKNHDNKHRDPCEAESEAFPLWRQMMDRNGPFLLFSWLCLQDAHLQGCEKNRQVRHKRKLH
jgi:hypothetical protein